MTNQEPGSRRGWRLFHCDACNRLYWRATRDALSVSGCVCCCGEDVRPRDFLLDDSLPVDNMLNLTAVPPDRVL